MDQQQSVAFCIRCLGTRGWQSQGAGEMIQIDHQVSVVLRKVPEAEVQSEVIRKDQEKPGEWGLGCVRDGAIVEVGLLLVSQQ